MDFSFISDISSNPIERLIRKNGSSSSKVKGIVDNIQLFFSSHGVPCYEKIAASLYTYLRLQGYDKNQIALLTLTSRQVEVLQNLPDIFKIDAQDATSIEAFKPGKKVEVYVILVGNDPLDSKISEYFYAFLELTALRIPSGLYLIGNPASFSACYKLQKILGCLKKNCRVSSSMILQCPRHKVEEQVRGYKDFPIFGGSFCSELCGEKLECGHACPKLCHFGEHDNQEGNSRRCLQSCGKLCPKKHPCTDLCHSECPPCKVVLPKTFSCGHKISFKCSEPEPEKCDKTQRVAQLSCGHEVTIICNVDEPPKCKLMISQKLSCGHNRKIECYRKGEPCIEELRVKKKCGHNTKYFCYEKFSLRLDNKLKLPCKEACKKFCKRGHPCSVDHKCGEACPPCETDVSFLFGECHHRLAIPCYQGDWKESQLCQANCNRPRSCDHSCPLVCGNHRLQKCPPCQVLVETDRSCGHSWTHLCCIGESEVACQELVDVSIMSACTHRVEVTCSEANHLAVGEAIFYCKSQCSYYFDPAVGGCGHFCTGICLECADNSFHHYCEEKCKKVLFCGHRCLSRCSSSCPPCEELCEYSCPHGRCNHLCGLPCTPCRKPCTYECPHGKCTAECGQECDKLPCEYRCPKILRCGHKCAGFCGEPCPTLCAICDEQELLSQDFLGKTSIFRNDR